MEEAGFLLPPPQTPAGVRVAAANIRGYREALGRPVAFETGVNYFRPAAGELADGDYFRDVAEAAGAGVLLDLHNLWCNERNGRQRVADALARIPLDRVWELHVAGGMPLDGYWLDGHCGATPPDVLDLAEALLPRLANVGALIFEILPEHLDSIGLDGVSRELEKLEPIWRRRPPRTIRVPRLDRQDVVARSEAPPADVAAVHAYEVAMSDALAGRASARFDDDPGTHVLRRLIRDFRSANLTKAMKYTMALLVSELGVAPTRALLDEHFRRSSPEPFAALEAWHFAQFLGARGPSVASVPYLADVMAFEQALLAATLFGETREVRWSVDPMQLLEALDAGHVSRQLAAAPSCMRVEAYP